MDYKSITQNGLWYKNIEVKNMHFTERLKSLREEHGLNQTQISKILSCTQTAYSKWELGQRDITVESLLLLAKYYNVSLDYITGASNIRSPYPKK